MNRSSEASARLLSCQGLTMHFGGLAALDSLNLDVLTGEVLGLVVPVKRHFLMSSPVSTARPKGRCGLTDRNCRGWDPRKSIAAGLHEPFSGLVYAWS